MNVLARPKLLLPVMAGISEITNSAFVAAIKLMVGR
jgi:hypothetical protein